jgi:hypothetical protein
MRKETETVKRKLKVLYVTTEIRILNSEPEKDDLNN